MWLAFVWLSCAASAGAQPQPLELSLGEGDIDLEQRRLRFSANGQVRLARLRVLTPDGRLLHEAEQAYDGARPGERLVAAWPVLADMGDNFRLELRVTDASGRWVDFEVVRFYLEIPHAEVSFASGDADIRSTEVAKLQAPLKQLKTAIAKYGKKLHSLGLYVAGHTDTVGSARDNQRLAEQRALAIARYFIAHGCSIPVFARGLGEGALAVPTGDNVPHPANRRAQYIISSYMPAITGPGRWRRVAGRGR